MSRMSDDMRAEMEKWRKFARSRPPEMIVPEPGQESVWDYPRPPRVEAVSRRVRVEFAGLVLAETVKALRVLETSSPPVYYIPPEDVRTDCLEPARGTTLCEWKGLAQYWSVRVAGRCAERAAWSYSNPEPDYQGIRDYLSFYAWKMDACYVGGQLVSPQSGHYYGGWVTAEVVGPFKGEPGTENW